MKTVLKCLKFGSILVQNQRLISLSNCLRIIFHDKANRRFLFSIEYGENAEITYEPRKDIINVIDLNHTHVPKKYRGKGIAQIMAEEVFEYIEVNHVKITISCPFLSAYVKDHPRFNHLIYTKKGKDDN